MRRRTTTTSAPLRGIGALPIRRRARRAFSLLETGIAVSILGIGLIMIAAVFPVALSQHRNSLDRERAFNLRSKAETVLRNRVNPAALPGFAQQDSFMNLLPFENAVVNGNWIRLFNHAATISQANYDPFFDPNADPPAPTIAPLFTRADILEDPIGPFPLNDNELNEAPNNMAWYGFYQRLPSGLVGYAVAIAKQRKNQVFYPQKIVPPSPGNFLAFQNALRNPTAAESTKLRLPVPWRVTVAWGLDTVTGRQLLYNLGDNNNGEPLSELAPIGAKIMIHGQVWADALPLPSVPVGRILTVTDVVNINAVEVAEDLSGVARLNDPADNGDNNVFFDVWIIPPAINNIDASGNATFAGDPPVIDWKQFL